MDILDLFGAMLILIFIAAVVGWYFDDDSKPQKPPKYDPFDLKDMD